MLYINFLFQYGSHSRVHVNEHESIFTLYK